MSAHFSSYRALVVDENPYVCTVLGAILESFDFKEVNTATNYEEAKIQMELGAVDCVILDWMETPSHGLRVVDDIRNAIHKVNPNVPIILCTGYTDVPRLEKATEAGVDEILVKPVNPKTVLNKIASAFYGPKLYLVNGRKRNKRRRFQWERDALKAKLRSSKKVLIAQLDSNPIH